MRAMVSRQNDVIVGPLGKHKEEIKALIIEIEQGNEEARTPKVVGAATEENRDQEEPTTLDKLDDEGEYRMLRDKCTYHSTIRLLTLSLLCMQYLYEYP